MENIESQPLQQQHINSGKKIYEFHINNNEMNKKNFKHKNNSISTTKYHIITFLPKALLYQFFRLANVYFLIIAIIQSIDIISPLDKSTAWGPLAIVLTASLIREAFEDISRYKYDKILNSEPVLVYRNNVWKASNSGNLELGELVIIKEDTTLPADLILLDSCLDEGIAYIETGTLDGEKTKKQKIAQKETAGFFNSEGNWKNSFTISGHAICDPPNPELYKLDGRMELHLADSSGFTNLSIPIEAKQLMLKGSILKGLKWAIGYVVYTGHNNKLILNAKKPRMKYSRIEHLMSKLLIIILILQSSFCILCAAMNKVYYRLNIIMNPYMPKYVFNDIVDPVLYYFTYLLLLNTMIPISLIITLEVVKTIQGYFLSIDVEGFSHVRKKFIKAGSVSLNEELGKVNFIFSDKTGTLTCNKMAFKYGVIGDVCYEYVRDLNKEQIKVRNNDEDKLNNEMNIVKVGPNSFAPNFLASFIESKYPGFKISSDYRRSTFISLQNEYDVINEYWKGLALCHEVEVELKDNNNEYTSLSPDDIELVKTAGDQGYSLEKSNSSVVRRLLINGEVKEFKILHILAFDSTRKRMSIIIRDGSTIKLYIKGADTAVQWIGRVEDRNSRISRESRPEFLVKAKNYVDYFSNKGYRTLFVGMKILDDEEYEKWNQSLYEANMNLDNKEKEIERVYAEIEKNIYLLGATIVEDKLQDQVPETIRDLRLAGIKVWMLTGDKMDTANNIGLSCNLISKDLKIFKLCGEKGEKLEKLIEEYKIFMENNDNSRKPPFSIIIDAVALSLILEKNENIKQFQEISYFAASVICCRVSPLQKSEVVKIMKEYDPLAVTLAIGDGGNDVSMIMEAHIGIGLHGEEGLRAVQSSDYALGEFKILRRLLLFHGRANNIRISKLILYFFYKNFVFTITHFYFAFYNNCSGQTIIDDWFITMYNLFFTAFLLGIMAVIDFDVKPDDGKIVYLLMPFLYKENKMNPIFTKYRFLLELFRGIIHGLFNFLVLVFTLGLVNADKAGSIPDIWYFSVCIYTNIIFIVNMRILIFVRYHTWIKWVVFIIVSCVLYTLFLVVIDNSTMYNSVGTMNAVFSGAKFYLNFLLVIVSCALIDILTHAITILFQDSLASNLSIIINQQGSLNNNNAADLPKNITDLLSILFRTSNIKDENFNKLLSTNMIKVESRRVNEELNKIDRIKIVGRVPKIDYNIESNKEGN